MQYLEDDKNGHLYGKHVLAAIKTLRGMSRLAEEDRDVRRVMCGFVGKLSFREMCVVLKEQRGWREARDFFAWMKLQLCYRPNVMVYTLMLRIYGKIGKIKLAEQTFLEMLEAGCEPDEVACGTMLCTYARWGRHKAMFSFYAAVEKRGIHLSVSVFNFMLSSLQKTSLHGKVIEIWQHMVDKRVAPNNFTYTVVISSLVKEGFHDEAFKTFNEMKSIGYVPEEVIYSLLISASNKNGKWDEAQRLYEDMRSCKIVPSHFTCASLLSLYYKTEDYSKALSLFTEMQSNKIPADEVIYGLLIIIYGKLGLYEDAQKAFLEIEQLGLLTDEKTYLAMAQVHLNSGNFEKALSTIEQMQSRNIWLSRFGYIVLLQCYVMKEDLSCAEDTFQALSKTGLPDAGSCNDMLNLYVRLNLTEKAKKFILQMRKDGVDFDEELLKTVIGVLCKEGMQRDVEQLIGDKQTKHLVGNSRYFQSFFMAMQGKMRDHQNFMASNQVNSLAIVHILTLHLADGNTSKIEEILKLLLKNGSGLSVVNEIVGNFIRGGNISKA